MITFTFATALAAGLFSQSSCGPAGCPSPSLSSYWFAQPQYQTVQLEPIPATPTPKQWHRIEYQGGIVTVLGRKNAAGNIEWVESEQPKGWDAPLKAERKPVAVIGDDMVAPAPPKPEEPVKPADTDFRTHGVDWSKIHGDGEKWHATGDEAHRFVAEVKGTGEVEFPDDSTKRFLTVIGRPEDRKPVMDALEGQLADVAKLFHVTERNPDDKYVVGVGLVRDGKPSIIVQEATGRVIYRQQDFAGGAESLKANLDKAGALRKPNPAYDPAKDPTPNNSGGVATWVYIALAACVALLLFDPAKPLGNKPQ